MLRGHAQATCSEACLRGMLREACLGGILGGHLWGACLGYYSRGNWGGSSGGVFQGLFRGYTLGVHISLKCKIYNLLRDYYDFVDIYYLCKLGCSSDTLSIRVNRLFSRGIGVNFRPKISAECKVLPVVASC